MAIIGYCMKCKKKTEMKDTVEVTIVCGTGMYKILGK